MKNWKKGHSTREFLIKILNFFNEHLLEAIETKNLSPVNVS